MRTCIENTLSNSIDTVRRVSADADIATQHPCFCDEAHYRVGRIHLPIAPRCNIQCNFCERNMCATEAIQHPGWAAKLLSVEEAVKLVRRVMLARDDANFVVGVAGPGDPLANDQTFDTLRLIHQEYPHLLMCVCTNGLLLEDRLEELGACGVKAITVTVNAPSSDTGKHVYSWVRHNGITYRGEEAAALLISRQLSGLRKAAASGFSVKVNTVLIPGVNDEKMPELAWEAREAGATVMNVMPLIPCGKMRELRAPTCEELTAARRACDGIIPQFHRCEQCRADVIYLP